MTSVFIADDDENYRDLLQLTLEDACAVETVRGFPLGGTLVEHLARCTEPPSLVLLDLHMPDGSGLELLRRIRALHPRVPIAFLSGAAAPEERDACLQAGAFAFLRKPVAYDELVRGLQGLLDAASAGP